MKKAIFSLTIIGCSLLSSPVFSQKATVDSLGLPGDNLNLYGVLNVFQQSPTLEDFEKKLNDPDTKLNNLDLNGDDKADYIKVTDNVQGTAHNIVLQVAVNDKETQDVAVIDVDKDSNGKVNVQIIGDEALYGKDYIVEPSDATVQGTPNPGYKSTTTTQNGTNITNNYYNGGSSAPATVVYEPATWGIVSYMYAPSYAVYVSPWSWGFYPTYWSPWHPIFFHAYWNHWYHRPYYGYYHRTAVYRDPGFHSYYGPRRSVSITVNQRRETGAYRTTYAHPEMGPRTRAAMHTGPRSTNATRNTAAPRNNAAPRTNQTRSTPSAAPRTNNAPRSNPAPRNNPAPAQHNNPAPRQQAPRSGGGGGGSHAAPHGGGGGGHKGR